MQNELYSKLGEVHPVHTTAEVQEEHYVGQLEQIFVLLYIFAGHFKMQTLFNKIPVKQLKHVLVEFTQVLQGLVQAIQVCVMKSLYNPRPQSSRH